MGNLGVLGLVLGCRPLALTKPDWRRLRSRRRPGA
jgi:hypothetical protein